MLQYNYKQNLPLQIMVNEKPPYERVWELIQKYEGMPFYTKTGIPFTYHIRGNSILIDGTVFLLNPKMLRHAYDLWPVDGPGRFNQEIQKPSNVWAIFNRVLQELKD
jgi:hypothetical protein